MHRAKILAELFRQYPGLDKKFLGIMADKISAKITDETTIEGAVTELGTAMIPLTELAAEWQKEGDRRATDAVNTHKAKNPLPVDPANPAPVDPANPAKPVVGETATEKALRLLTEEFAALKKEKFQEQGKAKLLTMMKEAKIPESMAKHIVVTDETDFDATLAELQTTYSEITQQATTSSLKDNAFVPGATKTGEAPNKTAVDADIEAWAKKSEPATATN